MKYFTSVPVLAAFAIAAPLSLAGGSAAEVVARDPQPDNGISFDQGPSDMEITMYTDPTCSKGATKPVKMEYGEPQPFDTIYYSMSLSRPLHIHEQLDLSNNGKDENMGANVGDCGNWVSSLTTAHGDLSAGSKGQLCFSDTIALNCARLWKNVSVKRSVNGTWL